MMIHSALHLWTLHLHLDQAFPAAPEIWCPGPLVAIVAVLAWLASTIGPILLQQTLLAARLIAVAFMVCAFACLLTLAVMSYYDLGGLNELWGVISSFTSYASWSSISTQLDAWRTLLTPYLSNMALPAWLFNLRGVVSTMATVFSLGLVFLTMRYFLSLWGRPV